MSYIPRPYVFDNCIQSAESLKKNVSSNFNQVAQIFAPTLKVLGEWDDKRGRKVLNNFKLEADNNIAHINEAVNTINGSVDKCVSDLGAAKAAYNKCAKYVYGGVEHLSAADKLHREWREWKEVHW